jgi:hypothetical protein
MGVLADQGGLHGVFVDLHHDAAGLPVLGNAAIVED